jgi:hypothetical protein
MTLLSPSLAPKMMQGTSTIRRLLPLLRGQGSFAVILIGKAGVFRAFEARAVTLWGKR